MYKKQMGLQKIACLLAVISAGIWFVYCLGMITDIYDAFYYTMQDPDDLTNTLVQGSSLYYEMQPFNKAFLTVSISLILLAALLYLTNTQIRRRYYIGNYIAVGLYSAATLGTVVWSHLFIEAYKNWFLTAVDFAALKEWSEMLSSIKYTESTFLLDLHYGVAAIAVASVAVLVGSTIWKVNLMRGEKALLEQGKEAVA